MMGMCQMLRDGVIPPNRSLDCVDDELAGAAHFVWVRETLRLGEKFPMKAGLVTSLGLRSRVRVWSRWCIRRRSWRRSIPSSDEDYQQRADARVLAGSADGWPRRSPAGPRCTRSRPTAGSTTTRRRSGRRPTCCSIRRRGSARTAGTRELSDGATGVRLAFPA